MRDLDAASEAQSQSDVVRPFLSIEMDYPDGMVRATSLDRDIEIDGALFYGLATFGTLSEITEGAEQRSYGVTATLAGVPGNFSAYLSSQDVQGRSAVIKLGFVDRGYGRIGDMTTIFVGRMDTQDVSAGKTSAVQVAIESLLVEWEKSRGRRYTAIDQESRYPGDRGFEYVAAVANMSIHWP